MTNPFQEAYARAVNSRLEAEEAEQTFLDDYGGDLEELRMEIDTDITMNDRQRFDPADCPEERWAEIQSNLDLDLDDDLDWGAWDEDDREDLDPEGY